MQQHKKLYKSEELLRKVYKSLRDLQEMSKEIEAYLEMVERRRADNRSSVEQILKLDLDLYPKKKGGKNAQVS